jgi:ribosomal protein S12 methylthiotransferase accessory factor YcaO
MMEVIERDATARAKRCHGFFQRNRIDAATVRHPEAERLISALRERGFVLALWHAPSPTGVPVIWCHIMEDCDPDRALLPVPCEGAAARADAGDAICHAIYEAAQSRLTAISGARDDFTRAHLPRHRDLGAYADHRRFIAICPCDVQYAGITDFHASNHEDLVAAFCAAGCRHIYRVVLSAPQLQGVCVTKIFVPAMLPLHDG